MALMVGSSDVRTMPHTKVGKVLPAPIVKGDDEVVQRDR
jgi:hypothetical protein